MSQNPISNDDGKILLQLARDSIHQEFDKNIKPLLAIPPENPYHTYEEMRGAFVTLHKRGNLRGCIGVIEPIKPLYKCIIENAKHAAFHDTRFKPLSFEEMKDIKIEISILTIPEKISYQNERDLISQIRAGIDGVIIKKQFHTATFLPQVWNQLKNHKEFFGHLCIKAGISEDSWKSGDLMVSTYQVQSFEEED